MSSSETPTSPIQPAAVAPTGQEDSRTVGGTRRFYPKTHANYWKSRLEHRTYSRDGKTCEVAEWSVRIHYKGIRKSFDLETASKEEAATKARDIYLSIVVEAAVEKCGGRHSCDGVGDCIAAAPSITMKDVRRYGTLE